MKTTYRMYLCLLIATVMLSGCKNAEPRPSTITEITWFEGSRRFAGRTEIGFDDAEAIFSNYPDYPRTTLFWEVNGNIGSTAGPDPSAYYIGWSSHVRKLVLITSRGVYTITPDGGVIEAIWQTPGVVLRAQWAIDPSGRFVLVAGWDSNKNKDNICAIVDLQDKSALVHHTDSSVRGMAFTNGDTAIVGTNFAPLTVRRESETSWTFGATEQEISEYPGYLVGAIGEVPVYHRGDGTIVSGEHSIDIPGCVGSVRVHEGVILLLDVEGDVYRIDTDWRSHKIASFDPESIIRSGGFSGGFWIATQHGKVHTFTSSGREAVCDIKIPQSSSE